jgi:hypothetical protein
VVGGIESVGGALFGGVVSVLLTVIESVWHVSFLNSLEILGPGLLALGVARSPGGSAAELSRVISPLLPWRRREEERLRQRLADASAETTEPVSRSDPAQPDSLVSAGTPDTSTRARSTP